MTWVDSLVRGFKNRKIMTWVDSMVRGFKTGNA